MNLNFQIRFYPYPGSPMQSMILRATDQTVARRMFEKLYPTATMVGTPQVLR